MNYTTYTLQDFLADESFVNYCLRTNDADTCYWEEILANQPNLADDIMKAKQICLLLAVRVDENEKVLELSKLQDAIIRQEHQADNSQGNIRTLFSKWWFSVAASLLFVAAAYLFFNPDPTVEQAVTYALEQSEPPTFAATTFDERRKISLPDGTSVLLNGTSQLQIAADFNEKHRVVWLVGEAYFEVAKDKTKPFVVRTSSTVTTALGTSFKVKNYPNQRAPYVMLTSGRVQVNHINDQQQTLATTILQPGQSAVIGEGEQLHLSTFSQHEMIEWLDRKLAFQAAGFEEIKSKLCDIYGVSIETDQQLSKSVAFTGQFENRQLSEVLDAISFSNRVKFTITGNKITMKKMNDDG